MEDGAKKIKSYHLLDVEILTEANDDIKDHLESMVLGTPGGFSYSMTDFHHKLDHLGESYFLVLKKSGRLLGTICMVHRPLFNDGNIISTWYLRYFHIKAPMKTVGGKQKNISRESSAANRIILNAIGEYITNPEILLPGENQDNKSLLFCYIVANNLRSARWGDEAGIMPFGNLQNFAFTRFNPRNDSRVYRIPGDAIPGMKEKLSHFYRDYSLYFNQNLFFDNNYFIIREREEIVAGMQANPEEWNIIHKPGLSGFFFHRIMPLIPWLPRIINLREFRFAAIEGIYCKPGYEHLIAVMLEAICYRYNTHFAFCWADLRSPLVGLLNRHVRKGFISRFIHSEAVDIRIKFYNWEKEDEQKLTARPCYISCFDST